MVQTHFDETKIGFRSVISSDWRSVCFKVILNWQFKNQMIFIFNQYFLNTVAYFILTNVLHESIAVTTYTQYSVFKEII